MKLTEIAELVTETIITAPAEFWTGLKPNVDIPVINALYPTEVYSQEGKAIYILCDNVEYSVDEKAVGRQTIRNETRTKLITLAVSMKITEVDTENLDVTPWQEAKVLLDLKEELDEVLLRYNWKQHKLRIGAFTTQPAGESELETRYFIASTQIGFIDACMLESLSTPPSS